jgi:peptidoglycan/xylan/chitin deacetylase (PgdA/CDA1 family)
VKCRKYLAVAILLLITINFATSSKAYSEELDKAQFIVPLLYHHIVPDGIPTHKNPAVISLSEFEAQMKFLYENGYYTVSLKELEDFLSGSGNIPRKAVMIAFDDGYESNYSLAFPVLKKYGFKAVIFLIGRDMLEKSSGSIPHLSDIQITEMAESGLIEFGSHTFNAHYYLEGRPIATVMHEEELKKDFEKMKEIFETKGLTEPSAISYPYGKYNEKVLKVAEEFYKFGFTTERGIINKDSHRYRLCRNVVLPGTDVEKFRKLLNAWEYNSPGVIFKIGSKTAQVKDRIASLTAPPMLVNGRALVPVRTAGEALGLELKWDSERHVLVLSREREKVLIRLNSPYAVKSHGEMVNMGAKPLLRGKVLLVPANLFRELGFNVMWDSKAKTIEIF